MKQRLTAGLFAVLVLALAAFTGSAFAGGNGNGSGSSNGNSANAPGHQDSSASQPAAPAPTAQPAPAQPAPQQSKKESKQSSTSASAPATGGSNANGVKPSSTTKHDTYAKASSDQTKKYGNGKTAGQIATQAGYGDATLHGPGNSQPHKTLCGGHEVDVHALKNKGSKCGTAAPVQSTSKSETKSETKTKTETKTETKGTDSTQTSQPCATTTKTVTVQGIIGVEHMIGPKGSGRFVVIHPSLNAAHYDKSKHPDDVVLYGPVTTTVTVPAANCASSTATPSTPAASGSAPLSTQVTAQAAVTAAPAATVTPAAAAPATASGVAPATATATSAPAASTPATAGGVKGAVVALHPTKAKPAGGVLGATTRLGNTVASTKLPFTGLPLWMFALAAAALIGFGIALRRTSADRI